MSVSNLSKTISSNSVSSVPDVSDPTVVTFSPTDEFLAVPVISNITVAFNETIVRGTGNIVLKTAAGEVVATYDAATSKNLSISGVKLTINPTDNLQYATAYVVEIAPGAIVDRAGNTYAGINDYNFKTIANPDTRAPTLTGFSPALGSSKAPLTSDIVVTFNETVVPGAGKIVLKTAAGVIVETYDVATSSNLVLNKSKLTINPTADFSFGTEYKLEFDAGSYKDLAGNQYAGTTSYKFKAIAAPDVTAPTVASISPIDGFLATPVASNIVVTFNETVVRGTGNIVLKTAAGEVVATYDAATSKNVTISGAKLTINPTDNLWYATDYTVEFAPGSIKDTAGNAYAGSTDYNFKTIPNPDTRAPTLSGFTPGDGTSKAALTSDIVASFNEPVVPGAGNIVLKTAGGKIIETYDVATSSNLTFIKTKLTINPTADFSFGTEYKLEFDAGTYLDLAGNKYAGTKDYNFTTVAAPDVTAPTIASFIPTDDSLDAQITGNIIVMFNEAVVRGTGNIVLKTSAGKVVATYDAELSKNLIFGGLKLVINPTDNLEYATAYTVEFAPGSIKDTAGNAYAGSTDYNFKTIANPDIYGPTVTRYSPADETSKVALSSNVIVTFDETVVAGTGNIVLKDSAGTVIETYDVATSSNIVISDKTLTIDPTADFSFGKGYKVEFAPGTIKDLAGNKYAGTTSYNFMTDVLDNDAPTVISFRPDDDETGVSIGSSIVLMFNESVARGTGNIILKTEAGVVVESFDVAISSSLTFVGSQLTIDPSFALVNNTGYQVEFSAGSIKDLAGNNYVATTGYNFKTAVIDTAAPTVTTFSPNIGETDVQVSSNIMVTFNEDIDRGTGNILLKTAAGAVVASYNATSSSLLSFVGNKLTINPAVDLSPSTGYKVEFAVGSVVDLAGNSYAGANNYTFTTSAPDTTAPTVTIFTPADEATNVAVSSNISLAFSESIQRGTGSILLKKTDGTVVATYDAATSSDLTISGSQLTINPSADLSGGVGYRVEFASGTIKDIAGNNYAGTGVYNFTTAAGAVVPTYSADDNLMVLQKTSIAIVGAGVGNDTYLISGSMMQPGQTIQISDAIGSNSLQLANGLSIASSNVSATALKLTLSNGGVVTVLSADKFTYDVGGNITAGLDNPDVSFSSFAQDTLGVSVPVSGVVNGGAKVIGNQTPAVAIVETSATDDFAVFTRGLSGIVGKTTGDDTYLLANSLFAAGQVVSISDTDGNNSIQLAPGLSIESSQATVNNLKLTLQTGATVTILNADKFTYDVGGNSTTGADNVDVSFNTFVQNTLHVTLVGTSVVTGGSVVI